MSIWTLKSEEIVRNQENGIRVKKIIRVIKKNIGLNWYAWRIISLKYCTIQIISATIINRSKVKSIRHLVNETESQSRNIKVNTNKEINRGSIKKAVIDIKSQKNRITLRINKDRDEEAGGVDGKNIKRVTGEILKNEKIDTIIILKE